MKKKTTAADRSSFTSLSLPILRFFSFCMCHAVRSKSLQPYCEMMFQIHKTLTISFQLLFIIYHSYFIFLWEDLYGCAQAHTCWCTLRCMCCCWSSCMRRFTASAWSCTIHILSDYKSLGSGRLSDVNLFLTSGLPGTDFIMAEQFCISITAFRLKFFPLL